MTAATLSAVGLHECRFERFGTPLRPIEDMTPASPQDATLAFGGENLRYYLMRLRRRPAVVASMTRHLQATQCLGSADAQPWWLAVAEPSLRPDQLDHTSVQLVRVLPGEGLSLHLGTWHAGPFFEAPEALFYNLELSDTNQNDHNCHQLSDRLKLHLS